MHLLEERHQSVSSDLILAMAKRPLKEEREDTTIRTQDLLS
jgi:hypothetical protein